jgi:hypothetical protein
MKTLFYGVLIAVFGLSLSACSFKASSENDKKDKVEKSVGKVSASSKDYLLQGKVVPMFYCADKLNMDPKSVDWNHSYDFTTPSEFKGFNALMLCLKQVNNLAGNDKKLAAMQKQINEINQKLKTLEKKK